MFDISQEKPKVFENDQALSEMIDQLRAEFTFFYPVDLRCSGRDLVTNHLAFYVFHHCAIWQDSRYWPRGIRSNGHLLMNGQKMSKSSGNFLTAKEAI